MGRKVLYSPGYGVGWTSWYGGTKAEIRFMLEYPPFIQALETVEVPSQEEVGLLLSELETILPSQKSEYRTIPSHILKVLPQFIIEFSSKFPGREIPYLGGLERLDIYTCESDDSLVKIDEYDGFETVEECYNTQWI